MIMWTVTSDFVKGIPAYFVEHLITGERRGMFDCEKWAEEFANELNRQEDDKNDRKKIRRKSNT